MGHRLAQSELQHGSVPGTASRFFILTRTQEVGTRPVVIGQGGKPTDENLALPLSTCDQGRTRRAGRPGPRRTGRAAAQGVCVEAPKWDNQSRTGSTSVTISCEYRGVEGDAQGWRQPGCRNQSYQREKQRKCSAGSRSHPTARTFSHKRGWQRMCGWYDAIAVKKLGLLLRSRPWLKWSLGGRG